MQLKYTRNKIELMPLQVMWKHINFRPGDIHMYIDYFKYIIACLNTKHNGMPRPQCEISFLQQFIKESEELLWPYTESQKYRDIYIDLILACASTSPPCDVVDDYKFIIKTPVESNNEYYEYTYLEHLTKVIDRLNALGGKEKALEILIPSFKVAYIKETYPDIKTLLDNVALIKHWKFIDNKKEIYTLLINNLYIRDVQFMKFEILLMNHKQKYKFFSKCLGLFGTDAVPLLLEAVGYSKAQEKYLCLYTYSDSYLILLYAIYEIFPEGQVLEQLWHKEHDKEAVKKCFIAFQAQLQNIKTGKIGLKTLFNFEDLFLDGDNYIKFNWMQFDWLVKEYTLSMQGMKQLINYFYEAYIAQKELNEFEAKAKHNIALLFLGGCLPLEERELFARLDFNTKKNAAIIFFSQQYSLKIDVFCALLSGLNFEQAQQIILLIKKINLFNENVFTFFKDSSSLLLELDEFDQNKRNQILKYISNEGSKISLAFATTQYNFKNSPLLEIILTPPIFEKIPFALAVAILNENSFLPEELQSFSDKFDEVNNRTRECFQIARPNFMTNNTVKIVNLYDLLGNYLFHFLSSKLNTSIIEISRFFENYEFISEAYFPLVSQLKKLITRNDTRILESILLLIGQFDLLFAEFNLNKSLKKDLSKILKKWSVSIENEELTLKEFLKLLTKEITHLYYSILNIADESTQSIFELCENKGLIERLLIGRRRIKGEIFYPIFDKLIAEDIKKNGSFMNYITNITQKDTMGRRLASFNQDILIELQEKNINIKLAMCYPMKHQFTIKTQQSDLNDLCKEIWRVLLLLESSLNLLDSVTYSKPIVSITKNINLIKKEITKGDNSKEHFNRLSNAPLQVHCGRLKNIFTTFNNPLNIPAPFLVLSKEFIEKTIALGKILENNSPKSKNVPDKKHFTIQQVDKSNITTLILGDYLNCCLAPDGGWFEAIVQRRIDMSFIIHIVTDEAINQPICGNWLFLAKDKDNPEDIYVVANFYEIRAGYGMKPLLRDQIVRELTEYTQQYANVIGAKGYLIRPLNYGLIPDFSKAIDYHDRFYSRTISLEKIGGYFDPRGENHYSNTNNVEELYYLEGVKLENFHQYSSMIPAPQEDKFKSYPSVRFFEMKPVNGLPPDQSAEINSIPVNEMIYL